MLKKNFFYHTYQFTMIFFYEIQKKENIFIQKINQKKKNDFLSARNEIPFIKSKNYPNIRC
jgi:hypothetical protein